MASRVDELTGGRKFKLAIATPFYEVKAYSPYITSLIQSIRVLNELQIEWDWWEISGDSYVDRAKNTLVHQFMQDSDFTHLMMIDSDLAWDVEGFIRVLKGALAGAEVIGGAYPNKNNWETFGAIPLLRDGKPIQVVTNGGTFMNMWGIPGGFLIYSRQAFERTQSNLNVYVDTNITTAFIEYFRIHILQSPFTGISDSWLSHLKRDFMKAVGEYAEYLGGNQQEAFIECFRCNIERDGGRVGEDIYFQQRYREMGGMVLCEPSINFTHYGVKGWAGNYRVYCEGLYEGKVSTPLSELQSRIAALDEDVRAKLRRHASQIEEYSEEAGMAERGEA